MGAAPPRQTEFRVRLPGSDFDFQLQAGLDAFEMFGFPPFPDEAIRGELERGALLPVPLREGAERQGPLYLVFADRDAAGPGALRLADIIRTKVSEECSRQLANSGSGS